MKIKLKACEIHIFGALWDDIAILPYVCNTATLLYVFYIGDYWTNPSLHRILPSILDQLLLKTGQYCINLEHCSEMNWCIKCVLLWSVAALTLIRHENVNNYRVTSKERRHDFIQNIPFFPIISMNSALFVWIKVLILDIDFSEIRLIAWVRGLSRYKTLFAIKSCYRKKLVKETWTNWVQGNVTEVCVPTKTTSKDRQ